MDAFNKRVLMGMRGAKRMARGKGAPLSAKMRNKVCLSVFSPLWGW